MSVVALRTALIWDDEVMADVVSERPQKITLGATGNATFVVPDVGLPANFAIVRPGNRGYLLTLGERMRGTICVDGEQRDVAEFVRRGGEGEGAGNFRATPISGRDWGVIDLDDSLRYKLFFQFVPLEEAPVFLTAKVLAGGTAGLVLSAAVMAIVFMVTGQDVWESIARGTTLSTLAILGVAGFRWLVIQDGESQASLAFSIVLHAALLFTTYQLYDPDDAWSWPGPRGMTGEYLATRALVTPPEPPPPTVGAKVQDAAAKSESTSKQPTATKGAQGASGGKGATERARTPNPTDDDKPPPPDKGVLTMGNRSAITAVIDHDLNKTLGRFAGISGDRVVRGSVGYGTGSGTGVGGDQNGKGSTRGGKGSGPGGGGNAEGDFVSNKGPIDTGTERPGGKCVGPNCKGTGPREVSVALAAPGGDLAGYTEDEINREIKKRTGQFRLCYQKALNRAPGLGGKIVVKFKIGSDGTVQSADATGASTLKDSEVQDCVNSTVTRMRFQPKGAIANVTYPFVFSQGG